MIFCGRYSRILENIVCLSYSPGLDIGSIETSSVRAAIAEEIGFNAYFYIRGNRYVTHGGISCTADRGRIDPEGSIYGGAGVCGGFDEIDHQARHIVVFNGEIPVGTCRFYWDQERNSYVLGRVAVRKAFRGQSLGLMLVQECEKQVIASKANKLFLAARVRVKEFYEKQGYTAIGQEFLEEYCPHIWMYKTLS